MGDPQSSPWGFNTKSSSNDLEDNWGYHHDEKDTSVDQVGLPKP